MSVGFWSILVAILLAVIAGLGGWSWLKEKVPFLSSPKVRLSYQPQGAEIVQGTTIAIAIENVGTEPVGFISVEVQARKGRFSVKGSYGDFPLKTKYAGVGTVITAQNALPQQEAFVILECVEAPFELAPPDVTCEGDSEFVGAIHVEVGSWHGSED